MNGDAPGFRNGLFPPRTKRRIETFSIMPARIEKLYRLGGHSVDLI